MSVGMKNRQRGEKEEYCVNGWHSVRTKLIMIMILLMGIILVAFWVMNYALLSPFYESRKVKVLSRAYDSVNGIVSQDMEVADGQRQINEQGQLKLDIIDENSGISLYVFTVSNYFGELIYRFEYPQVDKGQQQIVEDLTQNYLYSSGEEGQDMKKSGRKLIRSKDSYNVFKVYDSRIGTNYLELFGELESGSFVYLRTNTQNMRESISIFNQFIVYTGFGVVIMGVLAMIFFGNRFSKPIMQMTNIAKRMSELDFDVKYPVTTRDEIGVLGGSINMLSETLETTISELKSANNELQKDIEKKIQIDEMRKDFLSNVSHELKTPIALIQGYAEGLQENINDDLESREFYCEVIIDEARKMNKMVQKLLTLNQIEFGNNQVNFERFDIVALTRNIMSSVTLLAEQKEAAIGFDREYDPIYAWGDEYMVEEVVTNYISNAIHHVDGERRIEVIMEERDSVVRVRVFNTGKQIPEEDLDQIWVKFYKVDKARTREYGGSGIGLSIVKAVMDSMNQHYGVENRENGVEFWFELDRQN